MVLELGEIGKASDKNKFQNVPVLGTNEWMKWRVFFIQFYAGTMSCLDFHFTSEG